MDFIWESIVMVLTGILILRFSGRKSISQMTVPTTVVMISIGSVIVQPIIEDKIWKTIITVAIFVFILVLSEYLQMKFNGIEKLLNGKAKIVVENGLPHYENIKSLRLTVDKVEERLRQSGIDNMNNVKYATIEANGQLGYELKEDAKPLTIGEFKKLMKVYEPPNNNNNQGGPLFEEVDKNKHPYPNTDKFK